MHNRVFKDEVTELLWDGGLSDKAIKTLKRLGVEVNA